MVDPDLQPMQKGLRGAGSKAPFLSSLSLLLEKAA